MESLERIKEQYDILSAFIPKLHTGITIKNNLLNLKLDDIPVNSNSKPINILRLFPGETKQIYPEHLSCISLLIEKSLTENIDTTFMPTKISHEFSEELLKNITTVLQNNSSYICKTLFCLLDIKFISKEYYVSQICQAVFSEAARDILNEKIVFERQMKLALGKSLCESILNSCMFKRSGKLLLEYVGSCDSFADLLKINSKDFKLLLKKFKKENSQYNSTSLLLVILTHLLKIITAVKNNPKLALSFTAYNDILALNDAASIQNSYHMVNNKLKAYYMRLGLDILEPLYDCNLIIRHKVINPSKPKEYSYRLEFMFDSITNLYKKDLPNISPTRKNSKIEIRKFSDHSHYLEKIKNPIRNQNDGFGSIKNGDMITEVLNNTKFCINQKYLSEFLTLLLECFTLLKKDILELNELQNSTLHLRFLSELYGIDFMLLKQTFNPLDFILLLRFALDFSFDSQRSFLMPQKSNYGLYYTKIRNLIKSKKIYIVELLNSIIIMANFEYFSYSFFGDFRLRVYLYSSTLNPTLPLARSFLQFYDIIPVSTFDVGKLKNTLLEQLCSLTKTIEFRSISFEELNLNNILMNTCYKLTEAASVYHLYHDIMQLETKNYVFRFSSMVNFDSTNSGTQMLGLTLKSKSIGQSCKLVKPMKINKQSFDYADIYQDFLNNVSAIYQKIRYVINGIFETYPKLKDFFINHTEKILKLQYDLKEQLLDSPDFLFKDFQDNSESLNAYTSLNIRAFKEVSQLIENFNSIINVIPLDDYHFFVSSTIRKNLSLNTQDYQKEIFKFIVLTEMCTFVYLFDLALVGKIYERKLVKHMFMTSLYGSTFYGRMEQMMDAFYDICYQKGLNPSNSDICKIYYFLTFINKFLIPWRTQKHPKLILLHKLISKGCKKNANPQFSSFNISSPYSTFIFRPLQKNSMVISLFYKSIRCNYKIPGRIDYKRVARAFVANFMHFCDATLVNIFYQQLYRLSLQGFTIHDRFFMHPATGFKLYFILQKVYLLFYRLDLFKRNFSNTYLMQAYTNPRTDDYLHSHMLLHKLFVKP